MSKTNRVSIDCLLRVVDNYGDIGFLLELLFDLLERKHYSISRISVFTDNIALVSSFLRQNNLEELVELKSLQDFHSVETSEILFLPFQYPPPEGLQGRKLILSLDFLTFDPDRLTYHEMEHIRSTADQKIIHLVNSPLCGTLTPYSSDYSRSEFLEKYNLSPGLEDRKWITRFLYPDIPVDAFLIPENTVVFAFGDEQNTNHIHLPFLPFREYQNLLCLSDMNLVRGEVSLVHALHAGKPFLWDMYKGFGGWHREESECFLKWMSACGLGEEFRDLHLALNERRFPIDLIPLLESPHLFEKIKADVSKRSLTRTIENRIDSFYNFI